MVLAGAACSRKPHPKDEGERIERVDPLNTPADPGDESDDYVGPDDFTAEVTPTPSVSPSGTASVTVTPAPVLKPSGGFLAFKLTCIYTPLSPQAKWVDTWTRSGLNDGRYDDLHRYNSAWATAPATASIRAVLGGAIGADVKVRFKAEVKDPNVLHLWVTRTNTPDDYGTAAAVTKSVATMVSFSSQDRPPAVGSCTVQPAKPLPPESKSVPDDTGQGL